MVRRLVPRSAWMLVISFLSLTPMLGAQETYPVALEAPRGSLDSFLVLVPVRSHDAITGDIAEYRNLQRRAQDEAARAKLLFEGVEERMRLLKAEVTNHDKRGKAAAQRKDQPARLKAEADKKAAESRYQHLERRRDLREAELDMAVAHHRSAGTVVAALQREQALEERRLEAMAGNAPDAVMDVQAQTAVSQLELQVLEAQREAVKQREMVTQKERAVIERRIALLKAQGSL